MSPGVERNDGCNDGFRCHEENGAGRREYIPRRISALEATAIKTHSLSRFCETLFPRVTRTLLRTRGVDETRSASKWRSLGGLKENGDVERQEIQTRSESGLEWRLQEGA
jgi:hypothetical protein